MQIATVAMLILLLGGCASSGYRDTSPATFTGALDVRWVNNDRFLFLPNRDEPFALRRPDGSMIRPGPMYTDGGSIPRFLWGVEGFSPWGYAPAYIVHDWLFEAKHCDQLPDNAYDFDDTVEIMAEGLKAVMEASPEVRNYFVFDAVVAAVGSSIARKLWTDGTCRAPPAEASAFPLDAPPGELLMTIRFE